MKFIVALTTPFDDRGQVDLVALRAHVLWLCAKGVDGFVTCGTTGEFFYLSERERESVHRTVIETVAPLRKLVYCHTYDTSPQATTYMCRAVEKLGATGILLPPPLYYPLDEATVETWYRGMSSRVDLPIWAYHNPRYIPSGLSPALYQKLRTDNVIQGIKDSSGDVFRLSRLGEQDPGNIFAGSDRVMNEVAELDQLGGFVSGIANVWPTLCLRVFKQRENDLAEALQDRIVAVRRAGGIRAMKGLLGMGCRMPLLPVPVDSLPAREPI